MLLPLPPADFHTHSFRVLFLTSPFLASFFVAAQVRKKDSGEIFAMKVLSKALVVARNQVEHTQVSGGDGRRGLCA